MYLQIDLPYSYKITVYLQADLGNTVSIQLQNYRVPTGRPGEPWAADGYKITVYLQADLGNHEQ